MLKTTLGKYLSSAALALVLSACGSGGGRPAVHPEQPQAEQVQKQDDAGSQSGETAAPVEPSKPAMPSQPAEPLKPAEPPHSDKKVLENLLLTDIYGGSAGGEMMKLVFDDKGRKVDIELLNPDDSFAGKEIRILRDSAGKMIGYYGYVLVNNPIKNDFGEFEGAKTHPFHLQSADESTAQRPAGLGELNYRGSMLYTYAAQPNTMLEADVSATYFGKDKTMSMNITDRASRGEWVLHQERSNRSALRVPVDAGGKVSGYLFRSGESGGRPALNGTFSGGFYGTDGSVLTGRAVNEGKDAWQGAVGAVVSQ